MLIPLAPPHIDLGMDQHAAEQMIARSKVRLIRWVSGFDCQNPTEWWYVVKDGTMSLDELSRNSRHDVRRGLKRCYVEKLDAEFIANHAYPVYKKAFSRFKTQYKPISEAQFIKGYLLNSRKNLSDYWGVFDQSSRRLIGYCKNRYQDRFCEYLTGQFDPEYLKNYSSTVLIYEMNCYYLNERGALYVSDGQRSISHDTNIQEFLIHKLNFRKAYCRLNIVYSPSMRFWVNVLFPFRSLKSFMGERVSAVLKQEEIRRNFE